MFRTANGWFQGVSPSENQVGKHRFSALIPTLAFPLFTRNWGLLSRLQKEQTDGLKPPTVYFICNKWLMVQWFLYIYILYRYAHIIHGYTTS